MLLLPSIHGVSYSVDLQQRNEVKEEEEEEEETWQTRCRGHWFWILLLHPTNGRRPAAARDGMLFLHITCPLSHCLFLPLLWAYRRQAANFNKSQRRKGKEWKRQQQQKWMAKTKEVYISFASVFNGHFSLSAAAAAARCGRRINTRISLPFSLSSLLPSFPFLFL